MYSMHGVQGFMYILCLETCNCVNDEVSVASGCEGNIDMVTTPNLQLGKF